MGWPLFWGNAGEARPRRHAGSARHAFDQSCRPALPCCNFSSSADEIRRRLAGAGYARLGNSEAATVNRCTLL